MGYESNWALGVALPLVAAAYLYLLPEAPIAVAALPFVAVATLGVGLSVPSGVFLSVLWIAYTLTLTLPLYWVLGRYFLLLIYLPINGVVFYKRPHDPASWVFVTLQWLFWDTPLLWWVRIMEGLGLRALQPFYSQITEDLAVGSIALPSDVQFLSQKGTSVVVNMCQEYSGPAQEYSRSDIAHVHLPTLDLCEPSFESVLQGLHRIEEVRRRKQTSGDGNVKVFVHCKVQEGIALLHQKRSVVETHVVRYHAVQRLAEELEKNSGDVRRVLASHGFSGKM